MNRAFWTIVFGLIFLISVGSVTAQKTSVDPVGPLWEDTAVNPHDFTNAYYGINGIVGRSIIDRRTGYDGLSVIGPSSNPFHRNIRIIATIPAYDQNGGMLFWYPLGNVDTNGFTQDDVGWGARQIANLFPVYVFPNSKVHGSRIFIDTRQAALIDNTWSMTMQRDLNPLGLRQVVTVNYTEKAYTKEGLEMMNYMGKKNGLGADGMPILRSMDDLTMMTKYDMILMVPAKGMQTYAIAPVITDPTNGVIARDAFLLFATKDGSPLPTESMFSSQFGCLQKTGEWCKE